MDNTPEHIRFPYRRQPGESEDAHRERLGEAAESVDRFIRKSLRHYGCAEHDMDDATQEIKLYLIQNTIEQYDARHDSKTKRSTFLCLCSRRQAMNAMRNIARRTPKTGALFDDCNFEMQPGPDLAPDYRLERFIEKVMRSPENYLTAKQAEIFRELQAAGPEETMAQVGKARGNKQHSTMYMMARRIRDRIVERFQEEEI